MRFLIPPGEAKAPSPLPWQGPSPLPQRPAAPCPGGAQSPPASTRPAHGGRFAPAGSGAGLYVSRTHWSPGHSPTRAGEMRVAFPGPARRGAIPVLGSKSVVWPPLRRVLCQYPVKRCGIAGAEGPGSFRNRSQGRPPCGSPQVPPAIRRRRAICDRPAGRHRHRILRSCGTGQGTMPGQSVRHCRDRQEAGQVPAFRPVGPNSPPGLRHPGAENAAGQAGRDAQAPPPPPVRPAPVPCCGGN